MSIQTFLIDTNIHSDEQIKEFLNGEFEIDIPNFKKWNPDIRHHRHWFALNIDWYRDPKIIKLCRAAESLWIRLLGLRAASGKPLSNLSLTSLRLLFRFQGTSMGPLILKLLKSGLISVRCCALQTVHITTSNLVYPSLNPKLLDLTNSFSKGEGRATADLAPRKKSVKKTDEKQKEIGLLVKAYVEAWQKTYGIKARPDLGGKAIGILKRMLGHRGFDEINTLLQVYCQMKNKWYYTRKHDLATFEANLNDVIVAGTKGYEVGSTRSWIDMIEQDDCKAVEGVENDGVI